MTFFELNGRFGYVWEAWAAIVMVVNLILRRRPGYAPGGAPTFLVRTRKVGKRKRPPVCGPFAALRGRPASRCWRGALRNSLRSLRSLRSDSRSESDHEAVASCGATATPPAPRRRRSHRGKDGTGHRCARPRFFSLSLWERVGVRASGAERSDGPCVFQLPSARAEARRAWGGHGQRSMPMLRALTCCGCLNGAAQQRSEFRSTAPGPSTAGCPKRSEGTRAVGSLFLCLLSFGEAKESRCAAGRISRPPRFHLRQK